MMSAINGLSVSLATILFGPLIGSSIDKYQRINGIIYKKIASNFETNIN